MDNDLIPTNRPNTTDQASGSKGLLSSIKGTLSDVGKQAVEGAVNLVTPEGLNAFSGRMHLHGADGTAPASLKDVDSVLSKAGSKGLDALMGPNFEKQALRGAEEVFSRMAHGRDRTRVRDGHDIGG
ncbi:hypothetical protein [Microvirga sesbaniae]|uniref:hypothetical protein n=1 Tax=Microvirga sesbaniae TaxID=681392 RepID=UPI0021C5788A|nr:hypothetical protein [Microvirga sp. HBU67692]